MRRSFHVGRKFGGSQSLVEVATYMKLRGLLVAGLLAPLFLTVNSARAAAVTGEANIAGNVSVNASSIVFNPTFVNTPGAKETGSFEGLTGGTIMSLFGGPATGPTHVPGF